MGVFLSQLGFFYLPGRVPGYLIKYDTPGPLVAGQILFTELIYLFFSQGLPQLGVNYGQGYLPQPVIWDAD